MEEEVDWGMDDVGGYDDEDCLSLGGDEDAVVADNTTSPTPEPTKPPPVESRMHQSATLESPVKVFSTTESVNGAGAQAKSTTQSGQSDRMTANTHGDSARSRSRDRGRVSEPRRERRDSAEDGNLATPPTSVADSKDAADENLPSGWQRVLSNSRGTYFYHHVDSGRTSWVRPLPDGSVPRESKKDKERTRAPGSNGASKTTDSVVADNSDRGRSSPEKRPLTESSDAADPVSSNSEKRSVDDDGQSGGRRAPVPTPEVNRRPNDRGDSFVHPDRQPPSVDRDRKQPSTRSGAIDRRPLDRGPNPQESRNMRQPDRRLPPPVDDRNRAFSDRRPPPGASNSGVQPRAADGRRSPRRDQAPGPRSNVRPSSPPRNDIRNRNPSSQDFRHPQPAGPGGRPNDDNRGWGDRRRDSAPGRWNEPPGPRDVRGPPPPQDARSDGRGPLPPRAYGPRDSRPFDREPDRFPRDMPRGPGGTRDSGWQRGSGRPEERGVENPSTGAAKSSRANPPAAKSEREPANEPTGVESATERTAQTTTPASSSHSDRPKPMDAPDNADSQRARLREEARKAEETLKRIKEEEKRLELEEKRKTETKREEDRRRGETQASQKMGLDAKPEQPPAHLSKRDSTNMAPIPRRMDDDRHSALPLGRPAYGPNAAPARQPLGPRPDAPGFGRGPPPSASSNFNGPAYGPGGPGRFDDRDRGRFDRDRDQGWRGPDRDGPRDGRDVRDLRGPPPRDGRDMRDGPRDTREGRLPPAGTLRSRSRSPPRQYGPGSRALSPPRFSGPREGFRGAPRDGPRESAPDVRARDQAQAMSAPTSDARREPPRNGPHEPLRGGPRDGARNSMPVRGQPMPSDGPPRTNGPNDRPSTQFGPAGGGPRGPPPPRSTGPVLTNDIPNNYDRYVPGESDGPSGRDRERNRETRGRGRRNRRDGRDGADARPLSLAERLGDRKRPLEAPSPQPNQKRVRTPDHPERDVQKENGDRDRGSR